MLELLRVENLALIEKEEIEFCEGLNVMTGETGAGKSIILGALDLALGGRIDKGMVRDSGRDAYVEAVFSLDENEEERLRAADFEPEEGQLIFSRKIRDGKSQARLNGQTVPAARQKAAGALLLDIYGQSEHQSLTDPKKHLSLLDEYVKRSLDPILAELAPVYREYGKLQKSIEEADIDEAQRKRDISYYSHVSEEIEEAHLVPGEDEELETAYRRMSGAEKIARSLGEVQGLLFEGEDVLSRIGESQRSLASVAGYDRKLEELGQTLGDAYDILEGVSHELISAEEDLSLDGEEFERVTRRLDLINDLKQKYGCTIEEIAAAKAEADEKLSQLNDHESYIAGLQKKLADTSVKLNELCEKAENIRKEGSVSLCEQVRNSLKNLNFLKADFEVELKRTSYSARGFNEGQFLISTNPGEPLKPLSQVASGGEMSRIMLALRTVLSSADDIRTMIFDEIDTGISGRTASAVARELAQLSEGRQVILITHLPQIAALSDKHFLIEKSATEASTVSSIHPLCEEEIIEELSRMLGGDVISDAVRESARQLREGSARKS